MLRDGRIFQVTYWDITGVTTTLTTLSADEINAEVEALLDVLGVANHVHVEDTSLVESVDNSLGWDTNGRHEEFGTALNDDFNELVQFTLGVVVAAQI